MAPLPPFSLRTLIVVMLVGGPACAIGWAGSVKVVEYWQQRSQRQRGKCGGCTLIELEMKWRENPDGSLEGYTEIPPQD